MEKGCAPTKKMFRVLPLEMIGLVHMIRTNMGFHVDER